jgi:hypothetical protein
MSKRIDESKICANYVNYVDTKFPHASKHKRTRELNDYWCTYLPGEPEACILRNLNMWAIDYRDNMERPICAGCGLTLESLNIYTVQDLVDEQLCSIPVSDLPSGKRAIPVTVTWKPT